MRDLLSNSRDLWYATYQGLAEATDENGDLTGESVAAYSLPVHFRANLSATRGTQGFTGTGSSYDYFGSDVKYDLIISTARMDLEMDEHSLVWDREPRKNRDGSIDYSSAKFRVKAVARGILHTKYAVQTLQHSER